MNFLTWKIIHIIAAIVYCGNLFNALLMARLALGQEDSHGRMPWLFKMGIRLDRWLTLPAWLLLMTSGIVNVLVNMYDQHHAPWVIWGFNFGVASGWAWFWKARRLRDKFLYGSTPPTPGDRGDSGMVPQPEVLFRRWLRWATIATLIPFAALFSMVFK